MAMMLKVVTLALPAMAYSSSYHHPNFDRVRGHMVTGVHIHFKSLDEIDQYVNSFPYKADKGDEWARPAEFFKNGGDCEDYAIAKLALARENGFDGDIVLAIDLDLNVAHAVFVSNGVVYDNQRKPLSHYNFVGKVKI